MTTPRWPRPASAMNGYAAPRLRVVTWCAGSFGMRSLTPVNGRATRPLAGRLRYLDERPESPRCKEGGAHMSEPQGPSHPLVLSLATLTVVSGVVDAVSYFGLGHVFTANMTGNVVLIGFALAGAPGFSSPPAPPLLPPSSPVPRPA